MRRTGAAEGSALVESAIVLPVFVLLVLCAIQLALLGRARLLVEYAAYRAARAGILWNGDPRRMQAEAIRALASTACPTRIPSARPLCALYPADGGRSALQALSADPHLGFPGVHVHILSPHWPSHRHLFDLGGEELDFDRFGPEPERLDATLLTIQLQYWFELKIPFADAIVWNAWAAAQRLGGRGGHEIYRGDYEPISERALRAMREHGAGRSARAFFIPVVAHHTMRMQSNFYARFIRDCSCFQGSGCGAACRAW
ncbi:MAG: TadE/TadG family type IV pilus assembly protein [Pseudomonadota bacterium]|nr:MAG: hypothetical protein DIU72_01675 [Pseudomonadota bacterium]